MEIRIIQGVTILGIIIVSLLIMVIKPVRDWFFGPPEIDDRRGFPYSRKK
jgi:hypothetical protein